MSNTPKVIRDQDSGALRWQVPSMNANGGNVIKREIPDKKGKDDGAESGIPTAEEIENWHQQAQQEGYQEGLKQAQQEINQLKQRLLDIINFFEQPLQSLNEEVEQQLNLLAVTLAQQLVRREIRAEPGEIIAVIRESIQLLPASSRRITIKLNPEDAELVKSALTLDKHEDELNWRLLEDPMMTRGGCEIKSEKSVINATLENRLQALAASILGGEREQDKEKE